MIDNGKKFTIIMPPPNVTGSLHMGHALTYTIQDALIRYHKSNGSDVHWQPGFDHAGIATQMLAEKELSKIGKLKHDISREEFLSFINDRKDDSIERISNQVDSLGMDVDWSIARFTLDEQANKAVTKVFVELYRAGLIYRDKRLVNWDPLLQTTLSDLEVDKRECAGKLYFIKYFGDDCEIEIATTRPETMFGDVAIAVHPDDLRYSNLIGKFVKIPISGRKIPIIADDYVEKDFGTGAVKITPAHDANDFEMGLRHNLEQIEIFDKSAKLYGNAVPADFQHLTREIARESVITNLQSSGNLIKEEAITHSVPYGDRSNAVIEPMITLQWFFDVSSLAENAIKAVENGDIEFIPHHWTSTYVNWLQDVKPWCISRQLIWGHQIPAWYDDEGNIFVAEIEREAYDIAKISCNGALHRDNDVLDTWFSSALWPFSSLGWPDETKSLKEHYPSSVLVTGFDIIFFWVARMIMMGQHFMNEVPFRKIYICPIVCDASGNKMSKTKGNAEDPLEIASIYSSDALRLSLISGISSRRNIRFDKANVELSRNFITKVQNAVKFCKMQQLESGDELNQNDVGILEINSWIVHELQLVHQKFTDQMNGFLINEALDSAQKFFLEKFCDWYIELSKSHRSKTPKILSYVASVSLKMLYPFAPQFTQKESENLSRMEIGVNDIKIDKIAISLVNSLINLIDEIRSFKGIFDLNQQIVQVAFNIKNDELQNFITNEALSIERLSKVQISRMSEDFIVLGSCVNNAIEIAFSNEILTANCVVQLDKKRQKLTSEIAECESRLSNQNFCKKATEEAVEKVKISLDIHKHNFQKIDSIIQMINSSDTIR